MQNYLYFIHCPIAFDREGHGEILEILLMIDLTRVKSNIPKPLIEVNIIHANSEQFAGIELATNRERLFKLDLFSLTHNKRKYGDKSLLVADFEN